MLSAIDPSGLASQTLDHLVVAVVDDDVDILAVMAALLKQNGCRVRTFACAEDFIDALEWSPKLDCIVVDIRLPKMDGLDLLRWLRNQGMRVPVIMMTGVGEIRVAVESMKLGASEFLEKPVEPHRLLMLVRSVVASTKSAQDEELTADQALQRVKRLTPRQREVLNLVSDGLTSKEIARELKTSHRTIEVHRATMMTKLGARSLAELIQLGLMSRGTIKTTPDLS